MTRKIVFTLVGLACAPAFAAPALPGLGALAALPLPNSSALSAPASAVAARLPALPSFGALPALPSLAAPSALPGLALPSAAALPALPGLAAPSGSPALALPSAGSLPVFAAPQASGPLGGLGVPAIPALSAADLRAAAAPIAFGNQLPLPNRSAIAGPASAFAARLPALPDLPAAATALTVATPGIGPGGATRARSGTVPLFGDYSGSFANAGTNGIATFAFSQQTPAGAAEGLHATVPPPRNATGSPLPPLTIGLGYVGPQVGPSLLPTFPSFNLGPAGSLNVTAVNGGPGGLLNFGLSYVSNAS